MRVQEIELRLSDLWQVPIYTCAIKKLEGKHVGSRGQGGLEQNSVLWTWQDPCTHALTAALAAKRRPTQHSSMDWEGVPNLPHP